MEGREHAGKHLLTGKMSAPYARPLCAAALLCAFLARAVLATGAVDSGAAAADAPPNRDQDNLRKIELFDGVSVKIPNEANSTDKLLSFEINTERSLESGRGKGSSKTSKNKKLLQRILPMFIMPFLIQSTIVPFFLSMLKFMLFKSLMVGKVALGLILFNAFKNQNSNKGRDAEFANGHYGYNEHGMEYGAYFN